MIYYTSRKYRFLLKKVKIWFTIKNCMTGTIIFLLVVIISIVKDLMNKDIRKCINLHRQIPIYLTPYNFLIVFLLFGWMLSPLWAVKLHLGVLILVLVYRVMSKYLSNAKEPAEYAADYVNHTCDESYSLNFIEGSLKRTGVEWIFYTLALVATIWRIKNPYANLNLHSLLIFAIVIPIIPPF